MVRRIYLIKVQYRRMLKIEQTHIKIKIMISGVCQTMRVALKNVKIS